MKIKGLFFLLIVSLLLWTPLPVVGEGAPPGLTGGPLESSNARFISTVNESKMGQSVAIAGDVNGDGYDDLLIGGPGTDELAGYEGFIYLIFGGPEGWSHNMANAMGGVLIRGETPGDWAGWSVSGAGDFNEDGFDDMLIGAPRRQTNEGAAYLILGRENFDQDFYLADADAIFVGAGTEQAGWNVSAAGDVDGDGYDDVIIGAPNFDSNHGRAYVMFGEAPPQDRLLADADVVLTGEAAGDGAGWSVAGAGDVDGDQYPDLLIGAPWVNFDEGRVYLVTDLIPGPFPIDRSLSHADRIYYGSSSQNLGWSVDSAGDMNGDGFADMLASFTTTTGGAYLVLGASTPKTNCTLDTCADQGYRGVANSSTGGRVAGVGDVNADGYSDLMIGACGYDNSDGRGRVTLILGEAKPSGVVDLGTDVDTHYVGMEAGDTGCVAQNGAGDVNGDGLSDLIIGAPGVESERGVAYLFFGDDHSSPAARYRQWSINYYGTPVGQSKVILKRTGVGSYGSAYVTRHYRNTCGTNFATNGLLWTVDAQMGPDAEFQAIFRYNDGQIAGWEEGELKLWYRERPCQEWTEDTGAGVDTMTNRVFGSLVTDPHREYTISPRRPDPTAVGATGLGLTLAQEPPWMVLGLAALVLLTAAVEWQRRRGRP